MEGLAQTMLSSMSDRRFSPWRPVQYFRGPKNGQVGAMLTTGRIKMKIAIPVFHTKISPRFDSTQEFILLEIDQSGVVEREHLSTRGWPLAAKVKQLVKSGVDILICGGIDRESLQHLSFNGLKVYSWVTGEVEDAITCFLDHGLESGIILGTQGTPQGRWLFCERRNHLCNMAQTKFHCEGKEVMRMPARDGTGPMGRNRRAGKYRNRNQAGKSGKPVFLTLFVNWAVKPFTMYAIALFFLGTAFYSLIGPEAVDYVKMPFGLDLPMGASHGAGTVVMHEGVKMLQVPLWRSYLAGCILLGIAPCTAMVLVWGFLARGNDGLTLVMVAINSLTMLVLYGVLGGFLLGVGRLPVPWQALVLSIGIYVALPLVAGYISRKTIINAKGEAWFKEKFLHILTPITIIALLITLVLLFSFKGEVIIANPLTILWIAIPLFIQTNLIYWLGYGLARWLKLSYQDAAPAAMIGASNHFEVAIATSTMLFGLSSGAALATVVGVLIEVPVMLMLVKICLKTKHWFSWA